MLPVFSTKNMRRAAIIVYSLLCLFFCVYMTFLQFKNYAEDKDASAISFRTFNNEPQDEYPAFSVCFFGFNGEIFNKDKTRNALADKLPYYDARKKYVEMLKGQTNITDEISRVHFGNLTVRLEDYLLRFSTYNKQRQRFYHYTTADNTSPMPMHITYQSPYAICYTKENPFEKNLTILSDGADFNATRVIETKIGMLFLFHQRGRLIKYLGNGNYISMSSEALEHVLTAGGYEMGIKVSGLEVLNKRSTSKHPCNKHFVDDDRALIHDIMIYAGCVPTYWENLVRNSTFENTNVSVYPRCKRREQLSMVVDKRLASSYRVPQCKQTSILHTSDKVLSPLKEAQLGLSFLYPKEEYKHIENIQSFDDETLLSMTGGYIGIFLGISLLQVPSLLEGLVKWLKDMLRQWQLGVLQQDNNNENVVIEVEPINCNLPQVRGHAFVT